jgi:long-subunit acyl-CoA synthetase (AMP-forming)
MWYYTGDVANVTSDDILFVYGRKSRLFADKTGFIVNLDNMERIIKNIPYIHEAILVSLVKGHSIEFILGIYPDESFVESKNLGLLQLQELLNESIKPLEKAILGDHKIKLPVRIKPEEFMKTFDDKIKLYAYPAINVL